MRNCPYCGSQVPDDAPTCASCAAALPLSKADGRRSPSPLLEAPFRLLLRFADFVFAHALPIALGLLVVWAAGFIFLILAG